MRIPFRLALLALASTSLPGAAFAANGCADGTFSRVQSPDGNSTSFLFDDFSAVAGGPTGVRRATTTCRLSVPVTQSEGHSVFGVDYRGFAGAEAGQTATIRALQERMMILREEISGPFDDEVSLSGLVGISGSERLDLSVVLNAAGPLDDDAFEAMLFLDSIDFMRVGYTTTESVVASANQMARQRQAIAVDLTGIAYNMLGQSGRFDEGSYFGAFGSSDAAGGFNARWEAGGGVSLFGGAAMVNSNASDALSDSLALFAGAVRYTTAPATWRAFGELGAWGSPDVSASLSRSYLNLDNMVLTGGTTSGSLIGSYARLGAVYAPDDVNELALSTRLARTWLHLDGFSEEASNENLFAAHMKSGRSTANTVSVEAAWSRKLDDKLDFTISGAAGRTFAGKSGVKASVDWVGDVSGRAENQNFATVGGRVGWKFTDAWQFNTSVQGTFRESESPQWGVGGQLKASF